MWKNRFKLGFRYLWKEKGFSAINIFGLAIGVGASLAIFLYAHYHYSFDTMHRDSERIFRLLTVDQALGVSSSEVGITTPAAGPTAFRSLPEVESQVRIFAQGQQLFRNGERTAYAENFAAVDSNFFDFFDFKLLTGNPREVLNGPDDVVISESLAEKLFGDSDPVGQSLEQPGNPTPIIVQGVFEDPPANSHLQFDFLATAIAAPGDSNTAQFFASWGTIAAPTYIKLRNPENADRVVEELLSIARENNYGENFSLTTQPFLDAHLGSTEILFDEHNSSKADVGQVKNLLLVAMFLLIIAAFNFMNLSTARSARRAKEIGLRKVIGAERSELIMQFLLEAVILVVAAVIIALVLLRIAEGGLGIDVPGGFTSYFFHQPVLWLCLAVASLLLGLLSGIYPAFVLSSFRPVHVLKGEFKTSSSGKWMRRILVTLQFAVSIAVIVGMLVVKGQVDYMQTKDMGFVKDGIVSIELNTRDLFQNAGPLRDQLETTEGVESIAFASALPGTGFGRRSIIPEGYTGEETWIFSICAGNYDFADVLDLRLKAGRWYDEEHSTDLQSSVVINAAAANALGWEDPIGKVISIGPSDRTIIGVIENFHYVGLRYPIEPLILMPIGQPSGTLVAKVSGDPEEVLGRIEQVWSEINPNYPFEYNFFDDQFNQLFTSDEQFAQVLTGLNGLAILIACLGLLGLSAYTVQSKTRELGIRKVLGADLKHMVWILSKEFWLLLFLANVVALPVAFYYMQSWLSEFVYRIDLTFWPFLIAVLATSAIALVTFIIQAYRALRIDPVVALKYE